MAKIPLEVLRFIEERSLGVFGTIGYLATITDYAGYVQPTLSPKHFRVVNEETLAFDDRFSTYLKENITKYKHVAVIFVEASRDAFGYQLLGEIEYIESGDIYEESAQLQKKMHISAILKGVVKVHIKEVRMLVPGFEAGKKIS